MKKLFSLIACVVMSVAIIGCGSATTDKDTTEKDKTAVKKDAKPEKGETKGSEGKK